MAQEKLFQKVGIIAALTAFSRVLGVLRDSVCAAFFGGGVVWDAFSFAFRVPNLFRRLFGEGALSAAFIPIFTEYLSRRGRQDAWRLVGAVSVAVALVLLALLLLGEAFLLVIPRLCSLSERWRLALALTAVMLPYMLFICLTALAGAVLNSLKHFAVPALAPAVLNVCWIAAVVLFAPMVSARPSERIFVVAVGIVVAGVLQLALQLLTLNKRGIQWRLRLDLSDPGLRRIGRTMAPVMLGLAAFQVNVLIDGIIAISLAAPEGVASFPLFGAQIPYPMKVGANSVLYYANRLMQFPLGVFGIALATATFPYLSQYAANRDWRRFSSSLTDGLGAVIFIAIPAAVGLILLRGPAIGLLFERGAFTPVATARTSAALLAYCTGIWAYCAQHVLTRAFYSTQDTVTPLKVAAAVVLLNVALNLLLIWVIAEAGLAAATAISAACQTAILYILLARRVQLTGQTRLIVAFLKTALATVVMSGACVGVLRMLPPAPSADEVGLKLLRLLLPLGAGLASYLVVATVLRVREWRLIVSQILGGRKA